ncbi:hypothetical protein BDV12DRAFT_200449 [Aspergillus spectabilis]
MATENLPIPASGRNWSYSFWQFWTPIDTRLMAWCCPCILFGKTQARIQDPTLANYSPCLLWCGLSCFNANFLFQAKKRDDLRKKYGIDETHLESFLKMEAGVIKRKHDIEGSFVEDLAGAFCCRCCGLVQEEKEVLRMQQGQDLEGYQQTRGMQYA